MAPTRGERHRRRVPLFAGLLLGLLTSPTSPTAAVDDVSAAIRERIRRDAAANVPLVAQVVVALCDNEHQGIVKVPAHLGDGQDPRSNLYWGALYGLRTFFSRHGWAVLSTDAPDEPAILRRAVFLREVGQGEARASLYVVADAWDGRRIREATERFLAFSAGAMPETIRAGSDDGAIALAAGGASHLVAYVGHDGLMDFSLPGSPAEVEGAPPRSAVVLACASKVYFLDRLEAAGAHPLLLTTGLMAPEAYTLDALLPSWFSGLDAAAALEAAARAYDRHQGCGLGPARRLFWGVP